MSGLPQTADISGPGRHFAFVPLTEVALLIGPLIRASEKLSRTIGNLPKVLLETIGRVDTRGGHTLNRTADSLWIA
jgi:hypothetical protein